MFKKIAFIFVICTCFNLVNNLSAMEEKYEREDPDYAWNWNKEEWDRDTGT